MVIFGTLFDPTYRSKTSLTPSPSTPERDFSVLTGISGFGEVTEGCDCVYGDGGRGSGDIHEHTVPSRVRIP